MIALPICARLQRVVLVDRAISLRDTTKFIIVTLRLFHKFIISLLFHRGWQWGGGSWRHRVCDNIKFPEENKTQWCAVRLLGCGVKRKSPVLAKTRAGINM